MVDSAKKKDFGKASELLHKLLENPACRNTKLLVMANKQVRVTRLERIATACNCA
eukprot:SAG31_NODE_1124_length_9772_cov_11.331541_12_plen_55_part_00